MLFLKNFLFLADGYKLLVFKSVSATRHNFTKHSRAEVPLPLEWFPGNNAPQLGLICWMAYTTAELFEQWFFDYFITDSFLLTVLNSVSATRHNFTKHSRAEVPLPLERFPRNNAPQLGLICWKAARSFSCRLEKIYRNQVRGTDKTNDCKTANGEFERKQKKASNLEKWSYLFCQRPQLWKLI